MKYLTYIQLKFTFVFISCFMVIIENILKKFFIANIAFINLF